MDAGWYNDPDDPSRARWYDGSDWTDHSMVKSEWAGPGAPPPPGSAQPAFTQPAARDPRTEAAMAKARYKASRPWWKRKRILLPVMGLVGIVGCSALVSSSVDDAEKELDERQASIQGDAELVSCGTGDFDYLQATIRVTNNSSERSNYFVEVGFESEDGQIQYATSTAPVSGLEPGQTREDTTIALEEAAGRDVSCRIIDVTRFTDEP